MSWQENTLNLGKSVMSGRAQVLTDLELYEETLNIYNKAITSDDSQVRLDKGIILDQKARIHSQIGDFPGAIQCFEESAAIYKDLIDRHRMADVRFNLGLSYMNMGIACFTFNRKKTGTTHLKNALKTLKLMALK